jgi:vacuolar protein sorting-associated protein 3
LNEPILDEDGNGGAVTVLASSNRRIQALQISNDQIRMINRIDLPGINLTVRRDSIACVADSKSYSLLDVERQLRIPLMSISSMDESPPPGEIGQAQSLSPDTGTSVVRSSSSAQSRPSAIAQNHSRSTSLGGAVLNNLRQSEDHSNEAYAQGPSTPGLSPSPQSARGALAAPPEDKPLPKPSSRSGTPSQAALSRDEQKQVFLKPHIASPTPEEFLVIRGTSPVEPCIGMFVNLDGDPTRAPINFGRYPKEVVVDGGSLDMYASRSGLQAEEEGFVLASLARESQDELFYGLEIQPLDPGENAESERYWLEADGADRSVAYGIRSLTGSQETEFDEIVTKLCQQRFSPFSGSAEASTGSSLKSSDSRTALSIERLSKEKELFERDYDSQDGESLPDGWESTRNSEAEEFVRRLSKAQTRLAVWTGARIWWAVRNPLIVRFDSTLESACPSLQQINRRAVVSVLAQIRRRDAQSELEFLTLGYLRQKVGLLLLISLLKTLPVQDVSDSEMNAVEEVLVESTLDPRVVLSLIPGVRHEIIEGKRGIWIYGGVAKVAKAYINGAELEQTSTESSSKVSPRILHFLRRFLSSWRGMKGMPSISDETEVFRTVDAALLLVLLELDQASPKGLGKGGVVRAELNALVDKGVDCFERAVDLLERYHRLYILSRLYQSRKMAGEVLATWKRIIEGERDEGSEFTDGEMRVKEYLTKIRNQPLIQDYGVWLANRNPKLGVQVFAEDKGRAPKFEHTLVVKILKEEAPDAVKYYLEHLVFNQGYTNYVNDLITYYLDLVVNELQSSAASREAVMATYDAYRALQAPKPTYRHFLTDNAPPGDEVWHSRLRLLQLLGGAHDYDTAIIKARLARLPGELLVPETIILSGREKNHDVALRLLVHQLGDYDTAVSYCLRGGTSIDSFTAADGTRTADSLPTVETQRQLFNTVLRELLALNDASDRVEQTGALLERFGGWFEVDDVLGLIPDTWSVDVVAGFLVGALRRLVSEKHESVITRALSGAANLRVSHDLVTTIDEKGPSIEAPT